VTPAARAGARPALLDVEDLGNDGLDEVLALATSPGLPPVLAGAGVAMVFEKPSARTRNASEMAVVALGGHPVSMQAAEVGIDTRERAEDVARTLACYHRVLCARVFDHQVLVRMVDALAGAPDVVPVVNLLSDRAHPCQAVADLLTLRSALAPGDASPAALSGRRVAYVGDANNVCRSLAKVAVLAGMEVRVASPAGFQLSEESVSEIGRLASATGRGGTLVLTDDPRAAAAGADALYTDVWTSMGQEGEAERRRRAFAGYAVDGPLLAEAAPDAVVLHCLPAHRGEEISAEVLEGPSSVVWRQAAYRLDAMRGVLAWLLGVAPGGPR
jgi:ornithine carbamoyltransferase